MLEVSDLRVYFGTRGEQVKAVDGVSFSVKRGQTVALVGESGCGKSVTALSLAKLAPQPGSYYAGGSVKFNGVSVLDMAQRSLCALRGSEISYVFQEPASSLNPVFKVGYQIAEAVKLHRSVENVRDEVVRLLKLVGISDPEHRAGAYPFQLSGGMQQRVMIAMALACKPSLLVADEPTTALDVTVQAQILELLSDLQQKLEMGVLLITHNLGLVADVAHFVNVMYAGRIVEAGPIPEILEKPFHPYTKALLAAVPTLSSGAGRLHPIKGAVPNPARLPDGCKFHPRCPIATGKCSGEEPEIEKVTPSIPGGADSENGDSRWVRCHYWK